MAAAATKGWFALRNRGNNYSLELLFSRHSQWRIQLKCTGWREVCVLSVELNLPFAENRHITKCMYLL